MRNLQKSLNTLLGTSLQVDGIVGQRTLGAIRSLREKSLAIMAEKGYILDESKSELIGIRLDDTFDNKFTDIGLMVIGEQQYAFPMSTLAGLYGEGGVLNPKWIDGDFGVGVVKEGQYLDCYSLQGSWWSGENFLYQIANMDYYRDGDKDTQLDRAKIYTGIKGFNFHSWANFEAEDVNNLSQGCQVVQASIWNNIVEPLLYKLSDLQKGKITYTLLHLNDFN